MPKRKTPFNNPFARLRLPVEAPPADRERPSGPSLASSDSEDDATLFRQAVGEVTPAPGPACVSGVSRSLPHLPVLDTESEAYAELCALVESQGPLDLSDTDEYIEGAIQGFDRRTLRRLRAGDYAIQGHLDLHGMTRDEAKTALVGFIDEARRRGHRLVLVVHGRGLHSKDQMPVLKESIRVWLTRGRIGRHVLAFTTARPYDGGLGAVYVLLRR